jgi:hypothetical protein
MRRPREAMLLAIIGTLAIIGSLQALPAPAPAPAPAQEAAISSIPVQTDDNLDPITLVFTGYAPSWWVASSIASWGDSAYCSGPKTVNGDKYNYTLEHPDPTGIACFGPRDHVRIWDMGYNPVYGEWSIGAAHHEHTVCDPLCHHVIDSWERAEADVRSAFTGGQTTLSVSNLTLGNAGYYQGVFNDGNATRIQLRAPFAEYPVVFNENGLSNRTSWSVTMNGTAQTSEHPDILFPELNGAYSFTVGTPKGFSTSPSSGTIIVDRTGAFQRIVFTVPWSTSSATIYSNSGNPTTIGFAGNATVAIPSAHLATSGNPDLSFTATEIGIRGVLNVTVARSALPTSSSIVVYVDGVRSDNSKIADDTSHYYIYFFLPYGIHSVEIQFAISATSYLQYVAGGALAASILGVVFVIFRWKKRGHTRLQHREFRETPLSFLLGRN